jgi:DNA-binding response OmpR family regulator
MTNDFRAGVEWFLDMSKLFRPAEMRLIWALRRADGQAVSVKALGKAVTGRAHDSEGCLRAHVSRTRDRALGMGMRIICDRNEGYRMVMVEREVA